jgi:hypothetical protein
MSRNEVLAGKAVVEFGIRSRIAQGMQGVQNDLNAYGTKIAGIGATIAASAGGLLAAPIQAASRMEETMSKFSVVFGEASKDVEAWSKTTAKAVGVSEESMAGMLAGMQDLLVPMGVMPSKAVGMSKTLSQLAVDLGSFNNAAVPDVFRDLMAAITGESEPMKKYGVIVTETAVKQELLNMALDPKTADDAAKAQARLSIIMRGTTAAQGDAIRTSDSFANQMKALWSSIMDTSAALGKNLVEDLAAVIKAAVAGVYAVRNFAAANQDLVRAIGLVVASTVGIGASLVATGVALKVAAASMSVFMTASKVAAAVAATAWSGVALAFSVLTIKSRITTAIIRTGWTVAAAAIGVAWTALTGALSVAMQGAIAVVTTAAIVAPWLAGAAAIAVAWFGLDAVMTAMAVGTAAAWSASAATVTTAWTAAAGVLIPLSAAIAGAYATSAAFITATWATLSAAFASSGAVGVAWAIATSAAWAAYGIIVQAIAIKQAIDAAIVSAAWAGASAIASAAWSGFIGVLTLVASPTALGVAAAGLLSSAWAAGALVASAAWSTAWAIITGPLLPIAAAIAAVVAVMGGIVAVATYAAFAGVDFASAWEGVKSTLGQLVEIINTTFDAIKMALGSGDYATATKALWLGIQAGFWVGVEGTLDAFKWLFNEAWQGTKRFFSSLLSTTWKIMKAVASAIMNPFAAAREIGTAIGELVGGAMNFDVSGQVRSSQQALKALTGQLAATNALAEAEKKREADRKKAEEERNAKPPMVQAAERKAELEAKVASGAMSRVDADYEIAKIDKFTESQKETMRASVRSKQATGEITPEEAEKQIAAIDGISDAYLQLSKNIEMEILALEQGQEAADRAKMAAEGLTEAQIKEIEVLKAKKKALEDVKAAQDKAMQNRVDGIFGRANELGDAGVAPAEIFKRVMDQINADQQSGKLTPEAADDARGKARDDLDQRINDLKQQGKALADSLRTPMEEYKAETKRILDLRKGGFIDDETVKRALAEVNKKAFGTKEGVDNAISQEKAAGPTATFSAFGAATIGLGQAKDKKELIEIAKNTRESARLARKERLARFGR